MKSFRKFSVAAVLLATFGIVSLDGVHSGVRPTVPLPGGHHLRADGGAPPAPPIPIPTNALLSADGGAPPAPPIPLANS